MNLNDEIASLNKDIDAIRAISLDAKKNAIRSRGARRWANLRLASLANWAVRLGEKIRRGMLE